MKKQTQHRPRTLIKASKLKQTNFSKQSKNSLQKLNKYQQINEPNQVKSCEERLFLILDEFEHQFSCPITQMPMKDPVLTQDGHSYQRAAIYKWLLNSSKSPKTGLVLQSKKLIPNISLRYLIEKIKIFKKQILEQKIYLIQQLEGFFKKQSIIYTESHSKINPDYQNIIKNAFINSKHNADLHRQNKNQMIEMQSIEQQKNKEDKQQILAQSKMKCCQKTLKIVFQKIKQLKQKINLQYPVLFKLIESQIQFSTNQKENKNDIKSDPKYQSFRNQENKYKDKQQDIFFQWIAGIKKKTGHQSLEDYTVNQLLQPYEYLLQKFSFQSEEIQDRYRKDKYSHEIGLWHNGISFENVNIFVKYDWNILQFLSLVQCDINDQQWKTLVSHGKNVFSNLNTLWIYGNNIITVREKDVQSFKKLKAIQFWHYNGQGNPLLQTSKQNLRKYKDKNPHIFLEYQP